MCCLVSGQQPVVEGMEANELLVPVAVVCWCLCCPFSLKDLLSRAVS